MTANLPRISLPKAWPTHVASAVLHVILAQFATAYTRGWAANSINARIRLKAKLELANQCAGPPNFVWPQVYTNFGAETAKP
jgi:hypothetical protein